MNTEEPNQFMNFENILADLKGLKPCPFCGSDNLVLYLIHPYLTVRCMWCGANGPMAVAIKDKEKLKEQIRKVIRYWEKRK